MLKSNLFKLRCSGDECDRRDKIGDGCGLMDCYCGSFEFHVDLLHVCILFTLLLIKCFTSNINVFYILFLLQDYENRMII